MLYEVITHALLGRLGGDEFGLLLEHCPLERGLGTAAEVLHAVRDFRFAWKQHTLQLSASIGVVPVSAVNGELETLLGYADIACYAAKEGGRNRVHVYNPEDTLLVRRHSEMAWVTHIRRALAEERLRLYAQPIVPVETPAATPTYYEVLVRRNNFV